MIIDCHGHYTVLPMAHDAWREEQKAATPLTSVATNKVGVYTLVHCSESRSKFETNRVWDSLWWWYASSAEFILKWEMSHLSQEDQEFSRLRISWWLGCSQISIEPCKAHSLVPRTSQTC